MNGEEIVLKVQFVDGPLACKAFTTKTPGLVIHPFVSTRVMVCDALDLWSVTHAPTGKALFAVVQTRRMAELIAEYAGTLGIDFAIANPSRSAWAQKALVELASASNDAHFAMCNLADIVQPYQETSIQ